MGDYQNRFSDGKSATNNTFALKIINEKIREFNQSTISVYLVPKVI
jgi:hypothetical protein